MRDYDIIHKFYLSIYKSLTLPPFLPRWHRFQKSLPLSLSLHSFLPSFFNLSYSISISSTHVLLYPILPNDILLLTFIGTVFTFSFSWLLSHPFLRILFSSVFLVFSMLSLLFLFLNLFSCLLLFSSSPLFSFLFMFLSYFLLIILSY